MTNQHNCLAPGINKDFPVAIVEQQLVKDFNSTTRERNFKGLRNFVDKLNELNLGECVTKFWIDGSFVSEKVNPNDIDMVFFLDALHPKTQVIMNNKAILRNFGLPLHCDSYYVVDYETIPVNDVQERSSFEQLKKYWMGQFCFDRNEGIKGIIELKVDDFQ